MPGTEFTSPASVLRFSGNNNPSPKALSFLSLSLLLQSPPEATRSGGGAEVGGHLWRMLVSPFSKASHGLLALREPEVAISRKGI